MEKLKRELEEKVAEVTRINANLQSSQMVNVHLKCYNAATTLTMLSYFSPSFSI